MKTIINLSKKRTPQQFYKDLGAKGLAKRKEDKHTKKELAYLKKILNKKQQILDLACGYGRFTIPLARQGYNIKGIDISPNLIKEAKSRAKKNNLEIDFRMGDMRKLPYEDNSFDAIICMWSAFIELIKGSDQIKALKEMLRVLDKGGIAFLDMPKPQTKPRTTKTKRTDVKPQKISGRIVISVIDNVLATPMYMHNKTTITELIKKIKPNKYKIDVVDFGGRDRMIVRFWK